MAGAMGRSGIWAIWATGAVLALLLIPRVPYKVLNSILFFGVYPIVANQYGVNSPSWLMSQQLKLGLDLKGGTHLVMQVKLLMHPRWQVKLLMQTNLGH